jgi:tRNA U34 5-methylaminomethyl-2-thiouridine-forming methyltransferase MnmC
MQQEIYITADGSTSIKIPERNISYHSRHGAIQESQHIFIEAGLKQVLRSIAHQELAIFEMGFGTGLNALLTFMEAAQCQQTTYYETVEAFPLNEQLVPLLNYPAILQNPGLQAVLSQLHHSSWHQLHQLSPSFSFYKHLASLTEVGFRKKYHLIYFDAFDPLTQPGLWTTEIFKKLYHSLHPGGVLLTYCSKTSIRRSLEAAGFKVEKIPGPMGKREVVRAFSK